LVLRGARALTTSQQARGRRNGARASPESWQGEFGQEYEFVKRNEEKEKEEEKEIGEEREKTVVT
jgi:hypothetical protein